VNGETGLFGDFPGSTVSVVAVSFRRHKREKKREPDRDTANDALHFY